MVTRHHGLALLPPLAAGDGWRCRRAAAPLDRAASGPDPRLARVRPALALLTRQPGLIAMMVQVTVADVVYGGTISQAINEAGTVVLAEYWWEVDHRAEDEQGQLRRQQRWGMGHRVQETAAAASLAAVEWVQAHAVPQ